jgi:Family of unknown function (DUF6525)
MVSNLGPPVRGVRTSRHSDMKTFDRLPQEVRTALTNTNLQWASKSALRLLQDGLPVPFVVKHIKDSDAVATTAETRHRGR